MNCLNVDFKIDGIEKVSGEFSDEFITHLFDNNEVVVSQTYRARMFLKFINKVYEIERSKTSYQPEDYHD